MYQTTSNYIARHLSPLFNYVNVPVMQRQILNVLRSSQQINHLKQIHALIVTNYQSLSPLFIQKLLYFSHLNYARKVFDEMPQPNERLYNAFITSYSRHCLHKEALDMFYLMRSQVSQVTNFTLPPVLKSCSALSMVELGKQVHSLIISFGFESNCFVQTALMDLYAKSGDLLSAKSVFDGILDKDPISYNCLISGYVKTCDFLAAKKLFDEMNEMTLVSWNLMISCYANSGRQHEAVKMYELMQVENFRPNEITLSIVLSVCANLGDLEMGLKLKKYVVDNKMLSNMIVATALVEMFVKCGAVNEAGEVFERMIERDVVTWGCMITGYVQNGRPVEALDLFERMRHEQIKPNEVTLVSVLSACAKLGSLETGERIGSYVESRGFESNIYIASALLTMYSRCGNLEKARQIFNQMRDRDIVAWNSMITGLAFSGCAIDAIHLFNEMRESNMKPDNVTFTSLLTACTHAGLVDTGLDFYYNMRSKYGIIPEIEHHACIVDLFCKAGKLDGAYKFICDMDEQPNVVIWGTLMSACRINSNTELAEIALKKLIELEPENSGNYVLLSNTYADRERWQDASKVRSLMKDKKVQKLAAYSWIELDDGVHQFLVTDSSHPRSNEIYDLLNGLSLLVLDDIDRYSELQLN